MENTVDYFINKFDAIPEHLWCEGELVKDTNPDCRCALGHCGVRSIKGKWTNTPESSALIKLFGSDNDEDFDVVYYVNDGLNPEYGDYNTTTPKKRILNRLINIKNATVPQANG